MSADSSTFMKPGGVPAIVVELTCDVCDAHVVHTDTVPTDVISTYLSSAGWKIVDADEDTQTTLCPRCAALGGVDA